MLTLTKHHNERSVTAKGEVNSRLDQSTREALDAALTLSLSMRGEEERRRLTSVVVTM